MIARMKAKARRKAEPKIDSSVGIYLEPRQWAYLLTVAQVGAAHTGFLSEKVAAIAVIAEVRQQLAYATRPAPARAKRG